MRSTLTGRDEKQRRQQPVGHDQCDPGKCAITDTAFLHAIPMFWDENSLFVAREVRTEIEAIGHWSIGLNFIYSYLGAASAFGFNFPSKVFPFLARLPI
jgi:hypothetical protein